jgi:hypothetical protein
VLRKLNLLVLPVLMLMLCGPVSRTQNQPEFKMPCRDVLKLGLEEFMNAYGEKTQDYSTYGQKQAYSYYVECKRPANDNRAQRLSEWRRKQVDAVRDALNESATRAGAMLTYSPEAAPCIAWRAWVRMRCVKM